METVSQLEMLLGRRGVNRDKMEEEEIPMVVHRSKSVWSVYIRLVFPPDVSLEWVDLDQLLEWHHADYLFNAVYLSTHSGDTATEEDGEGECEEWEDAA